MEPCSAEPAGWHIDLPAKLVIFPPTHSASYLPFSDAYTADIREDYMFGSFTTVEQFMADSPAHAISHMFQASAPEMRMPHGVRQALASPEAPQWQSAMDKEVGDLVDGHKLVLGTPTATDIATALSTLFVFSKPFKPDPTGKGIPYQIHKARMAGNGSSTSGYLHWESSSTTPDLAAFRLLFVFSGLFRLVVSHLDVSQAFLHAKLDIPVWIAFPAGYTFRGSSHALLHYALYGLKTAGASWQRLVHSFMHSVNTLPPPDPVLDSQIQYIERVATDIDFDYPGLKPEKNLADPYTKPVPPVKDTQPYFNMLFDSYMDMRKAALQAARAFGFKRWSISESSSRI
ncbi:hypothetical protein CYMTET_38343 [Cymbomonas tetramitiformis]|uniref:Reverse transcriptase Ty1/copia-type domain-containing protein n=1 Tax=Cymbomonas tetramitiformis TaxID=36881 RepID=A0AAE0F5C1_9CHLO|nr:hypothetical protein CYMTET_38343 [Cymbomonas tetramitiformis]